MALGAAILLACAGGSHPVSSFVFVDVSVCAVPSVSLIMTFVDRLAIRI
uniref:Uncharacterized protein n=1 Tax=Anguilla anguilla TaxID=7936 RepID=A0A0E9Q4P2_ANGAN